MTVEEVIARAAFEECEHFNGTGPDAKRWTWDDMPGDELDPRAYWLRKARAILSALKAAGLVIVPEEPTGEMIYELWGPYLSTSAHQARLNGYRAMIRAATSPDAPGTVLGSPHD